MNIKELTKKVENANKLNRELGFESNIYINIEENGYAKVRDLKDLKVFLDERYDSKTIREEIYPTELEKINAREYRLEKEILIGPYEYEIKIKMTLWG